MYGISQLSENFYFLCASGDQLRKIRRVVTRLTRTLASRLVLRRRCTRSGSVNLRKTLRKSMSTDDVPIEVVLAKLCPARPE